MTRVMSMAAMCLAAAIAAGAIAEVTTRSGPQREAGGSRQPVQTTQASAVPKHPLDIVLGRVTRTSATISLLADADTEAVISWGTTAGRRSERLPAVALKKGEPREVEFGGLKEDTRYYYAVDLAGVAGGEGAFHTARPAGSTFVFTVTADSHLDEHSSTATYERTLAHAAAGGPDFHIDLGDTFMTEKHATREAAAAQYVAQRYFLGKLAQTTPLMLVLGNHDGERPRGDEQRELAVWSATMRNRYFPNPAPDGFYTGNAVKEPGVGLLRNYYAWEWGDALFVVLDPYWFSPRQRRTEDNWSRTLGEVQYKWLEKTLAGSKAANKFVFIHHLVGGVGTQSRGGVAAAGLFEWGGKSASGKDEFAARRPGWAMPVHSLLVKHKVGAVFHGHDHLYAREELDGVVYQEAPQPSDPRGNTRSAAEYGYTTGTILGSSGHLRVTVSPTAAKVEYVRATDGKVEHAYSIAGAAGKR